MFKRRTAAALLSIATNSFLILLKLVGGLVTGSIAVLSDAVDGVVDLTASVITFLSVREATKPADAEHPFGHGKVESVSAGIQAGLILLGAVLIVYQAVQRFLAGIGPHDLDFGLGVMAFSAIINIFVGRSISRAARITDSVALEADSRHFITNVFQSLGVLAGLAAVRITGLSFFDPLVAVAIAGLLVWTAAGVIRQALVGLMDQRLPEDEIRFIAATLAEHHPEVIEFHDLRTRKAGNQRYVDLHLVVPRNVSVEEAHHLCDHLEEDIQARLANTSVTIHIEPCEDGCPECSARETTEQRDSFSGGY